MAKYTKKSDVTVEPEVATETTEKVDEAKTTPKEPVKKAKKKFDLTDMIPCHSVCQGGLYLEGPRTKMPYEWSDYGVVEDIEYRDLVELVRTRSSYIFAPFLIIEDEDFIEEFPHLKKFYDENYSVKELSDILELPVNQMIEEIKSLPKGAIETLKSIAAAQVSAGQLDSVRKIKALDNVFHTDLNLLSDLFE